MNNFKKMAFTILSTGFLIYSTAACVTAADVPRMTKEELLSRLEDPDLLVLDVRTEGSWKKSKWKVKGAIRENPSQVQSWAEKYPRDKTLVLYCS